MNRMTRRSTQAIAAGVFVAALALTGCSGSGSGGGATGGGTDEPALEAGLLTVDEIVAGTETAPPAAGPAAVADANVWWISCGESIPACSEPAAAAADAADELGWNFHIADGALNVGGGNATAIRTALADSPDIMILHGIGCDAVRQPLLEAQSQGVPTISLEGPDCDDTPLFSNEMLYGEEFQTVAEYFQSWGFWNAAWIAATYESPKIIEGVGVEALFQEVTKGFAAALQNCEECEVIDSFEFTTPDKVPNGPFSQRLRASLAAHPEVTVVALPVDDAIQNAGGAQDIRESGIEGLTLVGGTGSSPEMFDYIREGLATMITSHDVEWFSWAVMDNANRVLAGEDTVPQGIGIRAVTADANLPAAGQPYRTPVDFKSAYRAVWQG